MGVRVTSLPFVGNASVISHTEVVDSTIEQRTAYTPDGFAVHFGPNEVKNFLDDGTGSSVAAFRTDGIIEDIVPFGSSRS